MNFTSVLMFFTKVMGIVSYGREIVSMTDAWNQIGTRKLDALDFAE